jgi:hypothetical protein
MPIPIKEWDMDMDLVEVCWWEYLREVDILAEEYLRQ